MADLNVTRDDDSTVPGVPMDRTHTSAPITDPDHLLAERTHDAAPGTIAQVDDPELARLQIEQTRARMSETIDQIEGALLRKKEEVQEKLDVMAPVRRTVREKPYALLGGIFLAGLVLGYLTGEDDDDDDDDDRPRKAVRDFGMDQDTSAYASGGYVTGTHWQERADMWERRARRLQAVANRQEVELLSLRGEGGSRRGPRGLFRRPPPPPHYQDFNEGESFSYGGSPLVTDQPEELDGGYAAGGYGGGYDGMPLNDADSYPPRGEDDELGGGYGYGRDPLPAPV